MTSYVNNLILRLAAYIFILSANNLALAQDDHGHSSNVSGQASANPTEIPTHKISSKSIGFGSETPIKVTERWRRYQIGRLWERMNPGDDPIPEACVEQLLLSDLDCLDELNQLSDDRSELTGNVLFILSGGPTLGFKYVGMLLQGSSDGTYKPSCTVTLTAPDTVLTARHCVKDLNGDKLKVYFPFEGIHEVALKENGELNISIFCDQDNNPVGCNTDIDDLAIIKLVPRYLTLPLAVRGDGSMENIGSQELIVGFGHSHTAQNAITSLADDGIKRHGSIQLDQCNSDNSGRSLCFDFGIEPSNSGEIGSFGNQSGDSGGPMLNTGSQPDSMVGVANKFDDEFSNSGQQEGIYVNITLPFYNEWLASAYCTPPCNTFLGEATDVLALPFAQLSDQIPDIEINPWVDLLVITMNHEVGLSSSLIDLDLILHWPQGITTPPCIKNIGVEVCSIPNPPPGTLSISVERGVASPLTPNSTSYQLAAMTIKSWRRPPVLNLRKKLDFIDQIEMIHHKLGWVPFREQCDPQSYCL